MRIRQLHLLRYGHFTDASITLPAAGSPDMQMMFGENEAGKSTAKAAIEDLLFGIPSNSPRNFLHDYGAMRIGANLEKGGQARRTRCFRSRTPPSRRARGLSHPFSRARIAAFTRACSASTTIACAKA